MAFGKKLPKGMTKHAGKGGGQQMLPNRHAMNTLTKGDPMQRTMNNYAQETPGPADSSPSVIAPAAYACGGMI